ncbi:type II secretion system protein M [Pseudomonas sp. sp1636]|uniref:type II secretion system protein M n=1 Tax=Pseudomonas sp. sp1636 TaxID=3036707 RepID=UPI0025A5B4C9|nr:type II secretion system protein M [Pseudomonas sp. sp1636]MDM8350137.1 type II secretion system protein M [Pseudomonas sp. sp1636]
MNMDRLGELRKPFAVRLQSSAVLQRWRGLASRERRALSLLVLVVLLVLVYLLLWQPAQQSVAVARDAFERERALHAYMQAQAPLARSMASKPQVGLDPARLQGVVTASAAEQGLTIERLDSDSGGTLQVNVQPAPFAQLLRWFAALEQQGVQISEVGLDRHEDARVAARLSLRVAF